MRILAIRGANLASLAGKFELNLAEGPLAQAGVFAICGPTGAGKSTLLDAMCLALFDDAPRLDASSRVRVGREEDVDDRLTTSDPRTFLRKGTAEGYAEVDFRGVDGRHYRARWEVRRARGRVDGRLQPTAMSLHDLELDTPIAGSRKTDVKQAIEERLGLSFDQFRRSVLLAQGDFAAFLDADAKERAGLLERMTGTEIYGVISMEAHARAGEAKRSLEQLEERAGLLSVLSDAERAELESRIQELRRKCLIEERSGRDAKAALDWHAQLAALRQEENEAAEEHERIERLLALWETRRSELASYARALPVQPWLDALDRAKAALSARQNEGERAEAERSLAVIRAEEARKVLASRRAAAMDAEQAYEQAAPELARARLLDESIETDRAQLAELESKLQGAEQAHTHARTEVQQHEAKIAQLRADERAARDWLDAHRQLAPIAERWERNAERLARVVEIAGEVKQLAAAREAAVRALERAEANVAERAQRAEAAAAEEESARLAWEKEQEEARQGRSAETLALERRQWVARFATLQTMIAVAERAQDAHDAAKRQRDLAKQAGEAARRADAQAQEVERERDATQRAHREAQRARDLMRATLDLASHREELREGEPCPLCGSREHPFVREAPAKALLEAQDRRMQELAESAAALERKLADLRRTAAAERETQERAEAEAAEWRRKLDEDRVKYEEAARQLELEPADSTGAAKASRRRVDWGPLFASAAGAADGPLLDPASRRWLDRAHASAQEALNALDEEESARRQREERLGVLRSAYEAARERAARAAQDAARATESREERARDVERLGREHAQRKQRLESAAAELERELEPFPGWRERLFAGAAAFAEEVEREVVGWRVRSERRSEAARAAAALEPGLEAARERLARALQQLEEARKAVETARAELKDKIKKRAHLLGGASADEHEQLLRRLRDEARRAAQEASEALAVADRRALEAEGRAERAREAREEAERDVERASHQLAAALLDVGLSEEEARSRLTRDREEMERWSAELAKLDQQRTTLATVLAERRRKREAHEAHEPPEMNAEQAREAVLEADKRLTAAREELVAEQTRLARDDEQRKQKSSLAKELERQREQVAVWAALSDLIGSANGSKLRVFAQSLTLEILLEHANHHLRELAPRYSLARVPGEDLALMIIDHEMGDEVRAVSTLSGGESFLVALGMALGLASLSSQRARIDSLFIDEGFGVLDPSSLDIVLSALDALQATGRQVGLISHVTTIAERFHTRVMVVPAGPAKSRVQLVEELAG